MKFIQTKWLLIFIQILLLYINAESQSTLKFETFRGTVYDLYDYNLTRGYGDYVYKCDIIGYISLDSLAVPKSFVQAKYFPGISLRTQYGIVFLSGLEINLKGCYEFSLESDDGSKLWIGDSLIIDNDGPHKMKMMRDTLMLDKGHYPVKVWYYSAFESQFGLILRGKTLPDSIQCDYKNESGLKRKLTLDLNNVLFDFNSYVISTPGMKELDKLCDELNQSEVKKIHIIGYTDNVGTVEYNNELSLKRAQSILAYLKMNLLQKDIIYEAEGRGSSNPVAPGEKPDAQQLNRRVEIYIE